MELKKEEVLAKLKANSIITVNGQMFFGRIEENEKQDVVIKDAFQCTEISIPEITKGFIRAMIQNKLQSMTLSGISSIITKDLTEDEIEDVEIACMTALRAARNAVPELMAISI